jgi:ArsR family transcriptional regulator, arsenate/arsenite/antimonite-responsive transcriptional repressor
MLPSEFFHLLSDQTRLRCLVLLGEHGELCVCELSHALEQSQPKISRHLAIMKANGLLMQRREGQWMFYALQPQLTNIEKRLIKLIIAELSTEMPFVQDSNRLQAMAQRPQCQRI